MKFSSKRERQAHIKDSPDCQDQPGISAYDLKQSIKKLQQNKMILHKEKINLGKNLQNVKKDLNSLQGEKNILEKSLKSAMDEKVKVDEELKKEKQKVLQLQYLSLLLLNVFQVEKQEDKLIWLKLAVLLDQVDQVDQVDQEEPPPPPPTTTTSVLI